MLIIIKHIIKIKRIISYIKLQEIKIEEENCARFTICALKNQGISTKNIIGALRNLDIEYTERGLNNVFKQYQQLCTRETNRNNYGSKSKTDDQMEEDIVQDFIDNQYNLREYQRDKMLDNSNLLVMTLSRILLRNGLNSYKISQVLRLTNDQKEQRLIFAKKFGQSISKWKLIAFSQKNYLYSISHDNILQIVR
ncbi:hypothetical protein ABPG72_017829 [Tetrahymena utriculariae]